jgi:hypothetical protein
VRHFRQQRAIQLAITDANDPAVLDLMSQCGLITAAGNGRLGAFAGTTERG